MSKKPGPAAAILCVLLACVASARAQDHRDHKLDREFQLAAAQLDAGRFAEAAAQLEALLPLAPNSFEVHELLGEAYAALTRDDKAIEHLEVAVRLKPNSQAARTNLAASLSRAGKTDLAREQFRKALELEPNSFLANHNLGEFHVQSGKVAEARPFLERAQQIDPSSYDNGYDLAMADFLTGHLREARLQAQDLLKRKDTAELHDLLGQIEEKDGNPVAAANEFQTAAHMDPSEDNLFDWGSELLLHRAYDPAIQVFKEAARRYPKSQRLLIGLGMALDWRGRFDEAVEALLKAADLDPSDARCYPFLSTAFDNSPHQAEGAIERFKRYAELEPGNAMAQYYYGMSLWKARRTDGASVDLQAVESLLKRSIALDQRLAEPLVQLGNLYADQHEYEKSIPEYLRALELNPNLPDPHYRLGTDYVHLGQKDKAQAEFAIYQKLRAQHLADADKEANEVQQFVYSEKTSASAKP